MANEKTNVMRVLDSKKIEYKSHSYEPDATMSGEEIAEILGESPEKVFKTLVTQAKSGQYYVFVVPVTGELDLKKAAKAAGASGVLCHQRPRQLLVLRRRSALDRRRTARGARSAVLGGKTRISTEGRQ